MADEKIVNALDEYKHTIYNKLDLKYKSNVEISDVNDIMIYIMKKLNKFKIGGFFGSKLSGEQKKDITVELTLFILVKIGFPDATQVFTVDIIRDMVEKIYKKGYHKK